MNTQNLSHQQAQRLVRMAQEMKRQACQVIILTIEANLLKQQRKQQEKSS